MYFPVFMKWIVVFSFLLSVNAFADSLYSRVLNDYKKPLYILKFEKDSSIKNVSDLFASADDSASVFLKVEADYERSSTFRRNLVLSMSINDPVDDVSRFTTKNGTLSRLFNVVGTKLLKGDSIQVSYQSGYTQLFFNGVKIRSSKGLDFFNLFTSAWVRDDGWNTSFETQLMASEKLSSLDVLKRDYMDLWPSKERVSFAKSFVRN